MPDAGIRPRPKPPTSPTDFYRRVARILSEAGFVADAWPDGVQVEDGDARWWVTAEVDRG